MKIDPDQFERLVVPLRERMIGAIWKIVRDPDTTEDLVQEALMRIVNCFDRLAVHPNPEALILRICINLAIDHLRRRSADNVRVIPFDENWTGRHGNHPRQTLIEQFYTFGKGDQATRLALDWFRDNFGITFTPEQRPLEILTLRRLP